jgi:hypothetical protein
LSIIPHQSHKRKSELGKPQRESRNATLSKEKKQTMKRVRDEEGGREKTALPKSKREKRQPQSSYFQTKESDSVQLSCGNKENHSLSWTMGDPSATSVSFRRMEMGTSRTASLTCERVSTAIMAPRNEPVSTLQQLYSHGSSDNWMEGGSLAILTLPAAIKRNVSITPGDQEDELLASSSSACMEGVMFDQLKNDSTVSPIRSIFQMPLRETNQKESHQCPAEMDESRDDDEFLHSMFASPARITLSPASSIILPMLQMSSSLMDEMQVDGDILLLDDDLFCSHPENLSRDDDDDDDDDEFLHSMFVASPARVMLSPARTIILPMLQMSSSPTDEMQADGGILLFDDDLFCSHAATFPLESNEN